MSDITTDPVAAFLNDVREHIAALTSPNSFLRPDTQQVVRVQLAEVAAPVLVAAVEAVLAEAAKAEHGALRWEDPLPVPEWVPRVRAAIAAALGVQT